MAMGVVGITMEEITMEEEVVANITTTREVCMTVANNVRVVIINMGTTTNSSSSNEEMNNIMVKGLPIITI